MSSIEELRAWLLASGNQVPLATGDALLAAIDELAFARERIAELVQNAGYVCAERDQAVRERDEARAQQHLANVRRAASEPASVAVDVAKHMKGLAQQEIDALRAELELVKAERDSLIESVLPLTKLANERHAALDQRDRAEAQAAAMRAALEQTEGEIEHAVGCDARVGPLADCTCSAATLNEQLGRALKSNAGKGWISSTEAARLRAALTDLLDLADRHIHGHPPESERWYAVRDAARAALARDGEGKP